MKREDYDPQRPLRIMTEEEMREANDRTDPDKTPARFWNSEGGMNHLFGTMIPDHIHADVTSTRPITGYTCDTPDCKDCASIDAGWTLFWNMLTQEPTTPKNVQIFLME